MNQALSTLAGRVLSNPHTSISAAVWGLCKAGSIWLPAHKDQFDATAALAVGYGLMMAGDSGAKSSLPNPPKTP